MKKLLLTIAVLFLAGTALCAQDWNVTSFRPAVEFDYKLLPDLKFGVEEELRFDSFYHFDRSITNIGVDYKVFDFLKVDAGYSFRYDPGKPKHRVHLQLTGYYKPGNFRFALSERVSVTHRAYEFNHFQNPLNAVELKTKFRVAYKMPWLSWNPYASAEIRNILNAVDPESLAKTKKEINGQVSYSDSYLNKFKVILGADWKLSSKSSLDIFAFGQMNYETDIDANAEGKLKAENGVTNYSYSTIGLGIKYCFSL